LKWKKDAKIYKEYMSVNSVKVTKIKERDNLSYCKMAGGNHNCVTLSCSCDNKS